MRKVLTFILAIVILSEAKDLFGMDAEVLRSAQDDGVAKKTVVLHTTKMGVYSDPENRERPGLILEIMQRLAKMSGLGLSIANLPWNRAVQTVGEDKAHGLVFPLIRSAKREPHYQWVIRVLNDRKVFFCKAGSKKGLSEAELKERRIGVIRGSPFEKQLRRLSYPRLDVAKDAVTNARKLDKGRIDYWFVTYNTAAYTFGSLGFEQKHFEVCQATERTPIYIAANRSFPIKTIGVLRQAFERLKASGEVAKLMKSYHAVDAGLSPGATSRKD